MENAAQAAARTNFRGSISACFEPHLKAYVDLEEKSLLEKVDQLVRAIPKPYILNPKP